MFREVLKETPLYAEWMSDGVFTNIKGTSISEDVTFVSTLRALLANRLKPDENVTFRYYERSFTKSSIEDYSAEDLVSTFTSSDISDPDVETGAIILHNVVSTKSTNDFLMERLANEFEKTDPEWKRLKKITAFFEKAFRVICFINPEKKKTILIADHLDIRYLHHIQCAIPAFAPWYFEGSGVNDEDMKLVHSLRERTKDKYIEYLAEIARKKDLRTVKIKNMLGGFSARADRAALDDAKRKETQLDEKIAYYYNTIDDAMDEKRRLQTSILGLMARIEGASGDDSLIEFFTANKYLSLVSVTNDKITFIAKGVLSYFDPENAEACILNDHSYIYPSRHREPDSKITTSDMKLLMKALFVDQSLKMNFCTAFTMRLSGGVSSLKNYTYDQCEYGDCTPNPHADSFSCMGNHERLVREMIAAGDIVGAVTQCIASNASLNFSDSTVMEEFMRRMYGDNRSVNMKCIVMPDDSVVTPVEAIAYLKAQEQEEIHNEQTD